MIEAIRRGDTVVTSGGIIGKVTKADDSELHVEVADGVRIKVLRTSISEVRGKGDTAASAKTESKAAE
jgi:preprotein translocase subunit YajC